MENRIRLIHNIVVIVLLSMSTITGFAQNPTVSWFETGGGSQFDDARAVGSDALGNVYVTGGFQGSATFGGITLNSVGGRDMFLVKYDIAGNVVWGVSGGGVSASERGRAIATDASGNSYVAGYFYSAATFGTHTVTSPSNGYDIFIAKYDANGVCLWATAVDGDDDTDDVYGIAIDATGNVYITGTYAGTADFGTNTLNSGGSGSIGANVYVAKYDNAGVNLWARDAGGNHMDVGYGIDVDALGNVYATGYFRNTATFGSLSLVAGGTNVQDIFIVKYNSAGVEQWAVKGTSPLTNSGQDIKVDLNGDLITTGYYKGTATFGSTQITSTNDIIGNPSRDMYVAKYTNSGTLVWIKSAGEDDSTTPSAIAYDSDNNVIIMGTMTGDVDFDGFFLPNHAPGMSFAYDDVFLASYDVNGNFQWAKRGGSGYDDIGYGLAVDQDDNIIITGYLSSGSGSVSDFDVMNVHGVNSDETFLVKYSAHKDILMDKTNVDCNGNTTGSIDITPNFGVAPHTYSWTGPGGFTSTQEDVSNLINGTYYITVTNGSGSITDSVVVVQPDSFKVTTSQNPASACNISDGTAIAYASGGYQIYGQGAYYMYWNGSTQSTGQLLQSVLPGPYQILVVDSFGCKDSAIVIVEPYTSDNDILTFSLAAQTGPAVIDAVNHTVVAEVVSGTGLTNLSPSITISDCATISPISGSSQDFSSGPVPYTVTAMDGTPQVWVVTITEEVVLGVHQNAINKELKIYPNPSRGSFKVVLSADFELQTIVLLDVTGQEVLSVSGTDVDASNLPKGLYFVKALDREDNIVIQKITIQ